MNGICHTVFIVSDRSVIRGKCVYWIRSVSIYNKYLFERTVNRYWTVLVNRTSQCYHIFGYDVHIHINWQKYFFRCWIDRISKIFNKYRTYLGSSWWYISHTIDPYHKRLWEGRTKRFVGPLSAPYSFLSIYRIWSYILRITLNISTDG